MLLEAAADIKGIERDLREMEVLRERGVEGAGKLEGEILYLRLCAERKYADACRIIAVTLNAGSSDTSIFRAVSGNGSGSAPDDGSSDQVQRLCE